jgi:4-hydroxy-tetrahydrodipicolinate reductase
LTSIQRHLDCLTIDEFADVSSRDSPDMLFRIMGFGVPPSKFDDHRLNHVRESFQQSLYLVTGAIGMPLDGVEVKGELATVRKTTRIAAGVVEAGTVGATRMTVSGMRGGRPLMRFRANWYISTDIEPAWDLRDTGWRVLVEGDAPLDISIRFPVPPEEWAAFTPGLTAHRPVNAISYVCAAPPGIRTTVDLPQIIPTFG